MRKDRKRKENAERKKPDVKREEENIKTLLTK